MKAILTFLVCLTFAHIFYAQTKTDSIIANFSELKSDTEILESRDFLINYILVERVVNWKKPILNEITNLRFKNQDKHADQLEYVIALLLNFNGDYSNSLKISTDLLARFKQRKDSSGIVNIYNEIAISYNATKNFEKAIEMHQKSIQFIPSKNNSEELFWVYNFIADSYASAFLPDSGLVYSQKSMKIANELKDDYLISIAYGTIGENYTANEDYDLAIPFLRKAISNPIIASDYVGSVYL